ncbi:hypothetical protein HPB49_007684 [Dermacentor silvarum]|uniref:Uncharacterized protein n=1 Tax=Dermacentor silvarum TaxID=543639 RepID=A0ACB8DXH5_DERSI|nr:hypothetical protein HPB49_007684 [Dermacentor silvarum]
MSNTSYTNIYVDDSVINVARDVIQQQCSSSTAHTISWLIQVTGDAFFVCDVRDLEYKVNLWRSEMPNVTPFFAVKCCTDLVVLRTLSSLGVNFDCSNKARTAVLHKLSFHSVEIEIVMQLGVSPERIVFANPIKSVEDLDYAKRNNVTLMTFDSTDELDKIRDKNASKQGMAAYSAPCPWAGRHGHAGQGHRNDLAVEVRYILTAPSSQTPYDMLKKAILELTAISKLKRLQLLLMTPFAGETCRLKPCSTCTTNNVHHRRSGSYSAVPEKVKENVNTVVTPDSTVLKGGGVRLLLRIQGNTVGCGITMNNKFGCSLADASKVLRKARCRNLNIAGVSFHIGAAFKHPTVFQRTIEDAKAVFDVGRELGFKMDTLDIGGGFPGGARKLESFVEPPVNRPRDILTTIWGATCHPWDMIVDRSHFFAVADGEWLVFDNMGAYTLVSASGFNGFGFPRVHYIASAACLPLVEFAVIATRARSGYGHLERVLEPRPLEVSSSPCTYPEYSFNPRLMTSTTAPVNMQETKLSEEPQRVQ